MPTTRVLPLDPEDPDEAVLDEAAGVLRAGGLVAFATETVYGLGALATDPGAVARIFEAKGRPPTNPLIVHVDRKAAALDCVAGWPGRAESLADRYWPGPLTLVLHRSPIIPDLVTAGQGTVGVRVPRPRSARHLIRCAGGPIAAPSANRSNRISPTTAGHVLKELRGRVNLILDSGPTTVGLESTVLDLTGPRPTVLRPGQITQEDLAGVLGEPVGRVGEASPLSPARSPGLLPIHYAPTKPAYRFEPGPAGGPPIDGRFALITFGQASGGGPNGATRQVHFAKPGSASTQLYATLHDLDDDVGVNFLILIPPPDEPEWRSIRDRIRRATRPWPHRIGSGP